MRIPTKSAGNSGLMWVAADTVYGVGEVEQVLRRAGRGYALAVSIVSIPGSKES